MNKGFWKGLGYGFVATAPLYLMLNGVFWLLKKLGILQPNTSLSLVLFISIYAIIIMIYLLGAKFYFQRQSSKNLEKLKKEVEEVTGRKAS